MFLSGIQRHGGTVRPCRCWMFPGPGAQGSAKGGHGNGRDWWDEITVEIETKMVEIPCGYLAMEAMAH